MSATTRVLTLDVAVPHASLDYPVRVGAGVLDAVGDEATKIAPRATKVALVSDANVMPLHGERVRTRLERAGLEVVSHVIPPGERSKSPAELLTLLDALLAAGLGRRDLVVALGGGVVGDLAGFGAAVFMRGIPFLQCPTTLLAQVDASVGGKVAIDLPQAKNVVGSFHFPGAVLIDPSVLQTLPDEELGCGLGEMLKHGLLFSREHMRALLEGADDVYARRVDVLTPLIASSVQLKARCVARDPREFAPDGRVLLNLGHSVGHAIESVSSFEVRHGQAVGLGLRAAARISDRTSTSAGRLERDVIVALQRLRLPSDLDVWLEGERGVEIERALGVDKKRHANTLTYIALVDVAQPRILSLTPAEILRLLRQQEERC